MRKNRFVTSRFVISLIAGSIAFSSVAILGENNIITQAQRPARMTSLLNAKCVSSGLGSVREENMDISIGRAVYSSKFYLGSGNRSAAITCKIKPSNRPQANFQTLNLGFGMRDNDSKSPGVEVRVYLDGRQAETRTVSPSQQNTLSLDVSNVSDVSIEALCTSGRQYCDRVYFFDAGLVRATPPPKQPKSNSQPPKTIDITPEKK
ncbi:hypothetical protein [Brunnivagina elsteri]|uniref:hypothetical protein n=1 Tax=Brunnivagina elsteri TaxID=1247191 RepID=UPI001B80E030|nr:hypothetical protein [Calothrix elsteri]